MVTDIDPAALLVSAERSGVAPNLRAALIRGGARTVLPTAEDDLLFDLASLTKPLCTGVCVLGLVARGQLSLDKPVKTSLPEITGPAGTVTVRQLLDHSSGLP